MRLGVDASNLRRGGGITHLVELFRAANPTAFGFRTVVVWAPDATLAELDDQPWLLKRPVRAFEEKFVQRGMWQRSQLGVLADREGCDLLFVPGGSFATVFRPVVVMSRNMVPFEWRELLRFGFSVQTVKMILLRWTQSRSLQRADGVIFLNEYARRSSVRITGSLSGAVAIIPHGLDNRFRMVPRPQRPLAECSEARPLNLIYVSTVDVYKHQWRVVEAVGQLREQGYPLRLDLVGPAYAPALKRLRATMRRVDPNGSAIRYLGPVRYAQLHTCYESADIAVFASSCENMPNVLLESMVSGLPVACSNRGPMPEVLGEAGLYFDPEEASDIARALREMIECPDLRARLAWASFNRAAGYSWNRCACETFAFLATCANAGRKSV